MHAFQTAASAFCIACICAEITTLLVGAGWAGRCIKAVAGLYILVILFRLAPQMKLELKSAAAAAPAAVSIQSTETCKENGMVPGARLLNRQIVPVRKDEEAFFHVGPEALLIYIQRLRTADGQPVFLENLFLPYEPYKNLMSENLNDVSMFDTIERISGLRPATTSCQRIEAVRASAEQAQLLNLSLGEPLLYLNAYFHDQYDHPLCIGRQYYIGSRYMFEF